MPSVFDSSSTLLDAEAIQLEIPSLLKRLFLPHLLVVVAPLAGLQNRMALACGGITWYIWVSRGVGRSIGSVLGLGDYTYY